MSGINDFAFKMATVNGTGSASANSLLMQAIFRMGIPVTGKNIFPSNIQGLPTFYEVRVSKDGYTARPQHVDLVVALNPSTYAKDVAEVRPGGYLMFDSSWPLDDQLRRPDVTYLGVTFGIQARKEGVVTPYKPATWNDIPNGLKDPDGNMIEFSYDQGVYAKAKEVWG